MTTVNQKVNIEVKNWLDKNIDPALRNSDEVTSLSNYAIEKVTEICESQAGYKLSLSDSKIIDTVNQYFTSIWFVDFFD